MDRRIRWHYTTTILRLRIGARLTRYRNCKFHLHYQPSPDPLDFDINFSHIITVAPRVEIQMHFWKGAKSAGSVGHPMTKMLSASGGFAALTRGFAPGPRWGLCPQTPVIGSCSALAMVPPQPLTPSATYDGLSFASELHSQPQLLCRITGMVYSRPMMKQDT